MVASATVYNEGDPVDVQISGEKVQATFVRMDGDKATVLYDGKEIKRKIKDKRSSVPKFDRDMIAHAQEHGDRLVPGADNPICNKCQLYTAGAKHPFLDYSGSETPVVTIVMDSVTQKEDNIDSMGNDGPASFILSEMKKIADSNGINVDFDTFRVIATTRCARRQGPKVDYKTKGRWCNHFVVQDLEEHRPQLIIPVGTVALGMLSHKSSAPDWAGRVLTYRGWPDPWITDKYSDKDHPVLGQRGEWRVPMFPILNPRMVYATASQLEIEAWKLQLEAALRLVVMGPRAVEYHRSYFEITHDPARVREVMLEITETAKTVVTFDTETTGLKQYKAGESIIYMMFRWTDRNGQKRAIGFPWDYEGSPIRPFIGELSEYILRMVYASRIRGHNLTFDMLWLHATLPGADLQALSESMDADTMHMLYAMKQARGSRGLELVAYDWCPEMAGYEEEMVLLIEKYPEFLDPSKGGHYANFESLKEKEPHVQDSFNIYVMGDVEVAHEAALRIEEKLNTFEGYDIPLASVKERGKFRKYRTPNRSWVFNNVLHPASRMLFKMMARGMAVDVEEVIRQEDLFPKQLKSKLGQLVDIDPRIVEWCDHMQNTEPGWELDLEKSDQLKEILFRILGLDVQRLTESGLKQYKSLEECTDPEERIKYAATDKYTLTRLISENPRLKPLQEYKKLFKAYSGYVRPMRNAFLEGFDKKERSKEQHLMKDGCVHGSFLLTGTRGGRLCVDEDTILDVLVNGEQVSAAIKDLERFNLQQVSIMTHKLRWRHITHLIPKGFQHVYKVVLENGEELTCTSKHRLYTPEGWKHLYELRGGDTVYAHTRTGGTDTRLEIYKRLDSGSADERLRLPRVWPVQKTLAVFQETVETSVSERLSKTGISEVIRTPARKYEWSASTVSDNSKGNARTVRISGFIYREDVKTVWYKLLHSCTKLAAVCNPRNWEITGKGSKFITRAVEKLGVNLSWDRPNVQRSSNRPCGVCKETVPSIPEANADGELRKGYCESKNTVFEEPSCSRTRRNLVQFKPIRDGISTGINGAQDSVQTRVCLGGQEAGRLSNQQEIDCGDRWRISRQREGCEARCKNETAGIHNCSVYDEANRACDARGDTIYPAKIVSIVSVGERRVYDITVEEDHSYVAQGFINHNCSKDPNLQQLPKDGIIKRFYISRFGERGYLYQGDLSQIELRLIAAACGDATMVDAYVRGIDLHTLTTSRIFHQEYDVYTKEHMADLEKRGFDKEAKKLDLQRKIGKTTNFLTGYGGGAAGLQSSLAENGVYISLKEAEEVLENFFDSYPTLRTYLGKYKQFILKNGVAVSITGRVREFNEVWSSDKRLVNKALRAGCNHLIQSTASDMMLVALNAIEYLMREAGLESMLISTVHDSFLIDAVREELPIIHDICDAVMNDIPGVMAAQFGDFDLSWTTLLPFNGDFEIGTNYLDAIKIPTKNPDWDEIFSRLRKTV